MANRKRKGHRVPEALRRAFGDRARTLAETVLSLLPKPPPPPVECRCRGRGCLGCAGGSSFLLRPEDGPDYRRLLNRCICVVPSDAPGPDDFIYRGEWTQRLIVRNTMELLMDRSHLSTNVLCEGYNKQSRFSLNGELLCDLAWNLLLTRTGESVMTFLLFFSSIFIPLPTNNHYQVAGLSLNKYLENPNFSHKLVGTLSAFKGQQALLAGDHVNSGCKLKRKRMEFQEKEERFSVPGLHHSVSLPVHNSMGSVCPEVCDITQKRGGSFNCNRCKKHGQRRVTEACLAENPLNSDSNKENSTTFLADRCSICTCCHSDFPVCSNMFDEMAQASLLGTHKSFLILDEHSLKNGREFMTGTINATTSSRVGQASSLCSTENIENLALLNSKSYSTSEFCTKSRKHRRLFSWQRHRKRKKANTLDDNFNNCSTIVNHKESSSRMFYDQSTEEVRSGADQMISTCYNCSMLRSPPKVTGRVEIRRKHMFYNSGSSPSIFPREHILNRLKPNNSGANALMNLIFCVSDGSLNPELASCCPCNESTTASSGCLYHSLLRILKALIHNAHKCHRLRLLHRHCSVPNFRWCRDNMGQKSEDVMQKEEYHVRKYARVICTKKSMRSLYSHICHDQSKDNDFVNSLASIRSRSSHGVLIDKGVDRKIKQVEIHNLLHEHVKTNMLQLGHGFYLQKSGITQGSLLSSLLCSFYYGHLERAIIFPFLEKNLGLSISSFKNCNEPNTSGCMHVDCGCSHFSFSKQHLAHGEQLETFDLDEGNKASIWKGDKWHDFGSGRANGITDDFFHPPRFLLLRLIDDFLFISTSRRQATRFFNRLCRGFKEYNCFMNNEKFGLNFDVDNLSSPLPNRRYVGADGVPFLPWSGLLVNCHTLEVQADYTRYLVVHLRSTLTVHAGTKREHLEKKLCDYMRPKCHTIFYDSNINSPAIVRLNVYQAFLLCAMKFHCYFCTIPNSCDLGPVCCLKIILKSFSYMHRLIKKRMYGVDHRRLNVHPVLKLKKAETLWLGLSAYIRVLRKKQSRQGKLLSLLKAEIDSLGKINCDPSHLKYAVDDSHSSVFWKIKY